MRRHALLLGLLLLPLLAAACGSDDQGADSGGDPTAPYDHGSDGTLLDPPGSAGTAGGSATAGGGGASGSSSTPNDGFSPGNPLGGFFRYGVNGGFPNPNWTDPDLAQLERWRGCNSQRVSLPETHLQRWGWEIELGDLAAYRELGLSGHVAFLTSPTREHSTAPASAADWELVHYMPKNLHEPILLDDGSINPDNYWGSYVYQTVKTYKGFIKIWEVWNEPDWVSDWQVTGQWKTRAPTAAELPRFNGSIYDYVRMLRVSKIAAQLADPEAKIATGGLGYSNFLGALLRYTDNPQDGSVTTKYPYTGGAYVDVLSFHHYPVYTPGNSDAAVDGYLEQVQAFSAELTGAGAVIDGWENTETGAPHAAVGDFPGGAPYAVDYLLKVMVSAQARGVDGVDWFMLADSTAVDATDDPYNLMGLYQPVSDLQTIEEAAPTDTGVAYATLSDLLGKARFDPDATAALALPDSIRGAAFQTQAGKRAAVLWARATGSDETATASLPNDLSWTQYEWDWAVSGESTAVAAGEPLALLGTPRLFVQP
jgi:hypothetical protein